MTARNKYGERERERLGWLYQLTMCATRPHFKLSNSRQDRWRPPNLQICNAMQSEGLRQEHVLRVAPPPSRVAVEASEQRAHLAVCLCACAAARSGNSVIVGKSRSGFRVTEARRERERQREDASLFIHPVCCKQASTARVDGTG